MTEKYYYHWTTLKSVLRLFKIVCKPFFMYNLLQNIFVFHKEINYFATNMKHRSTDFSIEGMKVRK